MTQLQKAFDGFDIPTDTRAKLEAKFIVPPFSVLDTRQGYWQERKRLWLSLGIQSEIGRGANARSSDEDIMRGERIYMRQEADRRSNVTGAPKKPEWATGTGTTNMAPGTSIFDPLLCELIYKWFCTPNGIILDPFAGGSVRGIVASVLDYDYHGIDLSQAQIEANREQAEQIVPDKQPHWYLGDSNKMDSILPNNFQADLIFSCPPYHDLEQYTDDMDDLSNMSWDTFKRTYSGIIAKCILKLKPNRFACFVISEIRDEAGSYKGLVPYTIQAFVNNGARYYNELILVNVAGSLPIRIAGQFTHRKIGRTHQNVLVFYKGDINLIPRYFKDIETGIVFNGNNNASL